jgi:hypothetical protein
MAHTLEAGAIKGTNGNSPRHAGGRPRKLTVARFLRICDLIEKEGKCNTAACRIEGVDYSGFRAHVRRKPWWQKRYLHADQVRDELLRDIYLGIITKHAAKEEGTWQAAAWLLERRWPTQFALHFTQHRTPESAEQPQYEKLTREELLASIEREKKLALQAPVGWQPLPDAIQAE